MSTSSSSSSGIGFGGLLTIVFVTLKLLGIIGWSWWWVLCPLWLPVAIILLVIGVPLFIAGILLLVDNASK